MSHVALIIPGLDRVGGAERQVILLAIGLVKRGWRVTVVALSGGGGDAVAELHAAEAGFMSLGMRKGLADPHGWLRFHRWLKVEAPEVVHAHLPHATWMARCSRLGSPMRVLVDTLHSSSTGTPGRHLGYRLSRWLPDRVTAVSPAVADAHALAHLVAKHKLTVLPNGIDLRAWRPDPIVRDSMRSRLGLTDKFLWFAAGRLEPVKDYPTLLRAFAAVPVRSFLFIAGAGPTENELRQLSNNLGIGHRVRWLGFESDVRSFMQAADGFVLASLWEGLPVALLEAAACALPAVATCVPGTSEIVIHRQTGLLSPPANAHALQNAMTTMMNTSPEERSKMGACARQRIFDLFSLETVLDRWEALYLELLTRNPSSRRWARN